MVASTASQRAKEKITLTLELVDFTVVVPATATTPARQIVDLPGLTLTAEISEAEANHLMLSLWNQLVPGGLKKPDMTPNMTRKMTGPIEDEDTSEDADTSPGSLGYVPPVKP